MKHLILFVATLLFTTLAVAGEKVVIIVDGNDNPKNLKDYFLQSADETAKMYVKNNYKVIRIDAAKGMGVRDFKNALAELKNVDEVAMAFFTHGQAINAQNVDELATTPENAKRFPVSYLRDDEVAIQASDSNKQLKNEIRYAFVMMDKDGEYRSSENSIGLGDLRDSIMELKKRKSDLKIKITALSCFSSNATRSLLDIPGVEVFTGNSSSQITELLLKDKKLKDNIDTRDYSIKFGETNDFSRFFLEELDLGKSYLSATTSAREKYLEERLKTQDFYRITVPPEKNLIRPQTSVELLLADQCLGNKVKKSVASDMAPVCIQSTIDEKLVKFATASVQPLLTDYLKKEITTDDNYLKDMLLFLGCNEEMAVSESNILKKAISDIKSGKDENISALQGDAKKFYLNLDKENPLFNQCLQDPMNCNHHDLLFSKKGPFPPFKDVHTKSFFAAQKLVVAKCPSGKLSSVQGPSREEMRAQQFKCIENNTPEGSMIRVFAFYNVIYPMPADKRKKSCALFQNEIAKNEKLQSCLKDPSKLGDDDFWAQMNSHYVYGQEKLSGK